MNYHSNEWIMDRLQEQYEELIQKENKHQIVGLFLFGSQNYGLDTSSSDVDSKAIIVPTLRDLALYDGTTSKTYISKNGGHIEVKDARSMFNCYHKQNINFIETIFTPYRITNPEYEASLCMLLDPENAEKIAHLNPVASINCMAGMAHQRFSALTSILPGKEDNITKYGYNPKHLYHILRMGEFINRYISNEKYVDCLVSKMPDIMIKAKNGEFTKDEAMQLAKQTLLQIDNVRLLYLHSNIDIVGKSNEATAELLDHIQYGLYYTRIHNEMSRGIEV